MIQSEERGLTALQRNAISRELFTRVSVGRRLSRGVLTVTTIRAYLRL
tara:strand:+ start:378 stop:521 length:144 start_codon:yes stop_codon:yes gene_type:complete